MKIFVLCSFILLIFTSCVSTHKSSTAQSIVPADFKNVYDESTFRENLYFISRTWEKISISSYLQNSAGPASTQVYSTI